MGANFCKDVSRDKDTPDRRKETGPIFYFDMVLDAKNLKDEAMKLFAEIRPAWKKDALDIEVGTGMSGGYKWGVLCQKQVSRAGTSDYTPQTLWDA